MRKLALVLATVFTLAACTQTGNSVDPPAAAGEETTLDAEASDTEEPEDSNLAKVGQTATADDGVEFSVTRLQRGRVSDTAAGGRPGDPAVIVTVRVKNGSKARMDLSEIDVIARLGKDGREAEQVYQGDFAGSPSGTLPPGRTSTSRYMFAGKTSGELRTVSVELSPGWEYDSATFEGSV